MNIEYNVFDFPIGKITIAVNDFTVVALHIEGDRYLKSIPKNWILNSNNELLNQTYREINEYFFGDRKVFDMPIYTEGTDFQESVWDVVKRIPFGSTLSYSDIAYKINKPKAARAVGMAIGRNPICLFIPCHRVVTSSGRLGGYVAGIKIKEYLLKLEGSYKY